MVHQILATDFCTEHREADELDNKCYVYTYKEHVYVYI